MQEGNERAATGAGVRVELGGDSVRGHWSAFLAQSEGGQDVVHDAGHQGQREDVGDSGSHYPRPQYVTPSNSKAV